MSQLVYYSEINISCIVILFVLFFAQLRNFRKNGKNRMYFGLLIVAILFCLFDLAAVFLRGQTFAGARELIWISNILYNVSLSSIGFLWILYSLFALEVKKGRLAVIIVAAVIAGFVAAFNVSAPFNGLVFNIDANNLYVRGPFVWINWAFIFPAEFAPIILIFMSKAHKNEKIAIALYPIFPMIAAIIQAFFYGVTVGQIGATVSLLVVYVAVQSAEANEQKLKLKVYDELCSTDELTGLNNRRAFINDIEKAKSSEWVGVIFSDINGLKRTNDKLGHGAGDELIKDFSNMLSDIFVKNEIYRISGDEFVILSTDRSYFRFKVDELRSRNGEQSSIGVIDGPGSELDNLLKQSEDLMYKDKKDFYERSGLDRRRN